MPFEFEIDVTDLDRYVLQLEQAAGGIDKEARGVAVKWANVGAGIAKSLVPVDTGRLKDSIEVSTTRGVARMVASAPYAGFVEFGTVRMAPQPYMRPAVAAIRGRFQRELVEVAARRLDTTQRGGRSALAGAVPRGTEFGQRRGGSRQIAQAAISQGGAP